jgi:hypothetical protein
MTLATLPKNPLTHKEFSLHDLFLRQSLNNHSGRLIEKVFVDVDNCLDFAQNRFGVTL